MTSLQRRPRVLVAQLGARRHYAVPRAFAAVDCLERVVTDACAQVAPWRWIGGLPAGWRTNGLARLSERRMVEVEAARIRGCFRFTLSSRFGRGRRTLGERQPEFWARQNEAFGHAVAELDWGTADTVYAFHGCALEVFVEARRRGLTCVLDQSAAPWRYNTALLRREQERWPGWEVAPADLDATGCMANREEAEWALADRIICGSSFVVDAMRAIGGPVQKTVVVAYPSHPARTTGCRRPHEDATRVLFAGTLQLRKGIQYFSQAAEALSGKGFVFRAIGPSLLTPHAEGEIRRSVDWRGSVPRSGVWDHYRWADAFLLPTLSEGSANVCLEAAATGLPVITTMASGMPPRAIGCVLAEVGDVRTMASALYALAASPAPAPDAVPADRTIADYGRDLVRAAASDCDLHDSSPGRRRCAASSV